MQPATNHDHEGAAGARESLPRPDELENSSHPLCALTSALSLIAGKPVHVPRRAYPSRSPSRLARLLQVGNGALGLLKSVGRRSTFITGKRLAYRDGEVEYLTGNPFKRRRSLRSATQPFFVVEGGDPAGSIAAVLGCDSDPAPRLYITRFQCTVVVMCNRDGSPAVMHYAACDDSVAELERTAEGLRIAEADPRIRPLSARLLAHRKLQNGAAILAQTRIPADPYQFSWRRVDIANELWSSIQQMKDDGEEVRMESRLDLVCGYFSEFRDLLAPAAEALNTWCTTMKIRAGLVHGDFWLGNVLFKDEAVAGIIDWEWARRDGIPLADTLHMLLRSPAMQLDTSFAGLLRRLWTDGIDNAELTRRLAILCSQSGMDNNDLKFLGLTLWFDILWQRAFRGLVESKHWLVDMIPGTAPAIMTWLGRQSKVAKVI